MKKMTKKQFANSGAAKNLKPKYTGKAPYHSNIVLIKKPARMTWPTYVYLRDLIMKGRDSLHHDFLTAHEFIPPQSNKDMRKGLVSARQTATDIFREKDLVFGKMLEELRHSAEASHKDNPNVEMRKFWGLE